jgi:hypothetical protein
LKYLQLDAWQKVMYDDPNKYRENPIEPFYFGHRMECLRNAIAAAVNEGHSGAVASLGRIFLENCNEWPARVRTDSTTAGYREEVIRWMARTK